MFNTAWGTIKPIVYVGMVQQGYLLLVKYKVPPNPTKEGWWIPAPDLRYGEDPNEKSQTIIQNFGLQCLSSNLESVESFVNPGGWHLLYHFVCQVSGAVELKDSNISEFKWVDKAGMAVMKDLAHGKWEVHLGLRYLS